ncbi:hypothetical protein [Mesobacillus harenae]|nr:hypothetical protein [Mesobacillus harenae]
MNKLKGAIPVRISGNSVYENSFLKKDGENKRDNKMKQKVRDNENTKFF